jgi:hypothetical protein
VTWPHRPTLHSRMEPGSLTIGRLVGPTLLMRQLLETFRLEDLTARPTLKFTALHLDLETKQAGETHLHFRQPLLTSVGYGMTSTRTTRIDPDTGLDVLIPEMDSMAIHERIRLEFMEVPQFVDDPEEQGRMNWAFNYSQNVASQAPTPAALMWRSKRLAATLFAFRSQAGYAELCELTLSRLQDTEDLLHELTKAELNKLNQLQDGLDQKAMQERLTYQAQCLARLGGQA